MEPQSALVLIADCTRMQGETVGPGLCDALFWGTSRSYQSYVHRDCSGHPKMERVVAVLLPTLCTNLDHQDEMRDESWGSALAVSADPSHSSPTPALFLGVRAEPTLHRQLLPAAWEKRVFS